MDAGKLLEERMSRHYYDFAKLVESDIKTAAFADLSLLDAVAQHKSIFFKAAWARYGTAKLGSLRLLPHNDLEKVLRADYIKMAEIFFDNPPSFDNILKCIGALEAEVNAIGQSV